MKNSFFLAPLLLLWCLSTICQAESYWSTYSPLPMDKPKASQEYPFTIITMMLPGNGQQQSQPQKAQNKSSGQQASGGFTFTTNPGSSGSGGGNEGSGQREHTFGLNCYVDSCHGVCELGALFDSSDSSDMSDLDEFFIGSILDLLSDRYFNKKYDMSDEYVHLAPAVCNALGEECKYMVDCCASCI
ncbi:hypothetical protein [Endozoicomonas sp. 4G]|uniref:hypothetical protein n=1 Tax=Endozoicomonas sp. 4G TaxID=2872754 RepID=UPI0020787EE4|nr:hypothetical protein [Endozoicomonas sp. 4G]